MCIFFIKQKDLYKIAAMSTSSSSTVSVKEEPTGAPSEGVTQLSIFTVPTDLKGFKECGMCFLACPVGRLLACDHWFCTKCLDKCIPGDYACPECGKFITGWEPVWVVFQKAVNRLQLEFSHFQVSEWQRVWFEKIVRLMFDRHTADAEGTADIVQGMVTQIKALQAGEPSKALEKAEATISNLNQTLEEQKKNLKACEETISNLNQTLGEKNEILEDCDHTNENLTTANADLERKNEDLKKKYACLQDMCSGFVPSGKDLTCGKKTTVPISALGQQFPFNYVYNSMCDWMLPAVVAKLLRSWCMCAFVACECLQTNRGTTLLLEQLGCTPEAVKRGSGDYCGTVGTVFACCNGIVDLHTAGKIHELFTEQVTGNTGDRCFFLTALCKFTRNKSEIAGMTFAEIIQINLKDYLGRREGLPLDPKLKQQLEDLVRGNYDVITKCELPGLTEAMVGCAFETIFSAFPNQAMFLIKSVFKGLTGPDDSLEYACAKAYEKYCKIDADLMEAIHDAYIGCNRGFYPCRDCSTPLTKKNSTYNWDMCDDCESTYNIKQKWISAQQNEPPAKRLKRHAEPEDSSSQTGCAAQLPKSSGSETAVPADGYVPTADVLTVDIEGVVHPSPKRKLSQGLSIRPNTPGSSAPAAGSADIDTEPDSDTEGDTLLGSSDNEDTYHE